MGEGAWESRAKVEGWLVIGDSEGQRGGMKLLRFLVRMLDVGIRVRVGVHP